MAADMNALTEMARQGFIPDSGTSLAAMLEDFPALFAALAEGLSDLSAWMAGTGFAETASAGVIDLAKTCGSAQDQAEEVAMSPLIQFLKGS